jgi:NTP pyrophosphatase (non-canonical NTP hydrolase)
MKKDTLDFIKFLTRRDSKSLIGKTTKLAEECGEVARATLPYDNQDGTIHRFVTDNKILEECADTMLVALSIAYSLQFDDDEIEDMIIHKAKKWQSIQERESKLKDKDRIPFEIHVTVDNITQVELFRKICDEIGVKPIVLDLHLSQDVIKDIMTSSTIIGSNRDAYDAAMEIRQKLQDAGFNVKRVKIETVPWHPAAPHNESQPMPKDCYFECHLPVVLEPTEDNLSALRHICKTHNAKLSSNVYKRNQDGTAVIMATLRKYDGGYFEFQLAMSDFAVDVLQAFEVKKEVVEFSIYDTNVSHDFNWIGLSK